jgi:hypothetical protein
MIFDRLSPAEILIRSGCLNQQASDLEHRLPANAPIFFCNRQHKEPSKDVSMQSVFCCDSMYGGIGCKAGGGFLRSKKQLPTLKKRTMGVIRPRKYYRKG